jgi:serine/threonine protein kinase
MSPTGPFKQSDSHEKVAPAPASSDLHVDALPPAEALSGTQTHMLMSGELSHQFSVQFSQKRLAVGQIIAGKYEILSHLGAGGMSVVYKARDRAIGRDVALKMLSAARMADEKSVRRFQQEGTAVGRLSHANIVSVHDFGVLETGEPFLVMDFAEGKTVAELLEFSGRFSPLRVMLLVEDVLDALVHAHEKGVVHRDLKPGNIILSTTVGGDETAKVFDFGIAKLMPHGDSAGHDLTQTGEVFGSPLYMSPEQCLGKSLDGRSDIYSLGCIIFEALAGQPPLQGETTVETIIKHVQEPPAPLSKYCTGTAIPAGLEQLVAKALAKNPDDRFQDAREMRNAVSSIISDLKSGAGKDLPPSQLGKSSDKSLKPLILPGFIVLAVLIVGALLLWMIGSFEDKKDHALRTELSNDGLAGMVDEAKSQTEIQFVPQSFEPFHVIFGAVSFDHSDYVIDDTVAARLANTHGFSELKLTDTDIRLTRNGLTLISRIPLQKVILSNAKFGPDFLSTICSIPSMRWLDLVEANNRELLAADMSIVAGCSDLTTLVVNRSIKSDAAFKPIEGLKKLETLRADECVITDESLDVIGGLANLRQLSLDSIPFGAHALRKISALKLLDTLNLTGSYSTDEHIEALLGCSNLRALNISNSRLSDEGLIKLARLKKLRALKIVNCPNLTNAGVSRFQSKAPQCTVNRSFHKSPLDPN